MSTRHLVVSFLLVAGTAAAQPAPGEPVPSAPAPSEPTEPAAPTEPAPTASAAPPEAAPAPAAPVAAAVEKTAEPAPKKEDKPLEVKAGGYLQADTRHFAAGIGTHEQTVRRLRFKVEGKALRYVKFRTLLDTAGSKLQVLDAWIELGRKELALRVGKDKGQFSIERLQSAAELTFIERAYPTQLAPNRDIGVALRGDLARGVVHYSAAVVDGVADNAVLEAETDDEYEYNAHLLVAPFKATEELGRYGDLAIGGATTFGRTHGTLANPGVTKIVTAGQQTIFKYAGGGATDTLATTAIADGYRKRFTGHAYYYGGPIGALAEYVAEYETVKLGNAHTDLVNRAWQVALSAALTPGDQPSYKSIVPKHPLDLDAGTWGAVEVAARYTELRLDDDAFAAGIASTKSSVERARAGTLGVNWYLNKWIKVQLDYEATQFTGGAETGNRPTEHLIATRFQAAI